MRHSNWKVCETINLSVKAMKVVRNYLRAVHNVVVRSPWKIISALSALKFSLWHIFNKIFTMKPHRKFEDLLIQNWVRGFFQFVGCLFDSVGTTEHLSFQVEMIIYKSGFPSFLLPAPGKKCFSDLVTKFSVISQSTLRSEKRSESTQKIGGDRCQLVTVSYM